MKKLILILAAFVFNILSAQVNIKVSVKSIAVTSNVDCDGASDDSDFLFEYKAQDNSPALNGNNNPVTGSIGNCNYAVVNNDNGPFAYTPSAPGAAAFSPASGLFFDHSYNCKSDVPTELTITWTAYENDDISAPSLTPVASGTIGTQSNTYTITAANGTYSLQYTQTSTDGSCPQTYILELEVEKSVGAITPLYLDLPEAHTICSGASNGDLEITAIGGSGTLLYDWSNDGTGDFDDNSHIVGVSAGSYTVVVKDNLNCRDSAVVDIIAVDAPIAITAFANSSASVCAGETGVVYSVASQTNVLYTWNYTAPGTVMNGTGNSITMDFSNTAMSGTLSVYAENSCSATPTATMYINVQAVPTISITGSSNVCENTPEVLTASGATTYTWSTGDISASTTIIPTVATIYTVSATGPGNCIATKEFTVNVLPTPTLQLTGSTAPVCPNQTVTVSANGNGSLFLWSDGFIGQNHNVKALTTTIFTVTNTFTNSCYVQQTFTLNVMPAPSLSVIGNSIICEGAALSYTANGADTYLWSNGITSNENSFVPVSSGSVSLVGTGTNGCKDSLVRYYNVVQSPTVTISGSDTICEGNNLILTASANGTVTYGWNSGANTPTISIQPSGTFTYVVTVNNGGCSASASHEVYVKLIPAIDFVLTNTLLCTDASVMTLTANPGDGTFYGIGVTGNSFDPSVGVGTYSVNYEVLAGNGCLTKVTHTLEVSLCTGVDESSNYKVSAFPNPASSHINVKSDKEIKSIMVYDFSGKLVKIIDVNTFETVVYVGDLARGLYTLTIYGNDNSQRVVKVVKD